MTKDLKERLAVKDSVHETKFAAKNWINWGATLSEFESRTIKYSEKPQEHGWSKGTKYFGEWSKKGKPYGRGICVTPDGEIYMKYWENGVEAPGDFVDVRSDQVIFVGKSYRDEEGKLTRKGTVYFPDGTSDDMED